MGILDEVKGKAGTLVAATMETTGTAVQSDMLDWLNGPEGQMLAGLFYLFAIVGGLFTFASGGSYQWTRYLLIGPAFFLFLTDVRVANDGTEWNWGTEKFADVYQKKLLDGVKDFENGKREKHDVAMFFQFWNGFISNITHELVALVKAEKDGSHLDFITKVEKYMMPWNHSMISSGYLRVFINVALKDCQVYFNLSRLIADPHTSNAQRIYYEPFLEEAKTKKMVTLLLVRQMNRAKKCESFLRKKA